MSHKRRPKWTQSLLSRVRHPSSVLVDIIGKARKDGAAITVRYNRRFIDVSQMTVDFDGESNIVIAAQFIVNDTRGGTITELVPFATDCVLEERITKLEALRRLLLQRSSSTTTSPTPTHGTSGVGEYCLYFESLGQRASAFEFYIDPRRSPRLLADYHQATTAAAAAETTSAKSFVDSEEVDHTSDYIDSPRYADGGGSGNSDRLQFIKPECHYVVWLTPTHKRKKSNGAAKRRRRQVCR